MDSDIREGFPDIILLLAIQISGDIIEIEVVFFHLVYLYFILDHGDIS